MCEYGLEIISHRNIEPYLNTEGKNVNTTADLNYLMMPLT